MREWLPSWINAVTVVVLAGITWWYAKSAKRQANAADSQARAAIKQAEAAEKQMAMLHAQIQEQAGIATATLRESVKELYDAVSHWVDRMKLWGQLTQQRDVDLLPAQWSSSLEHARKISPALYEKLAGIQRSSKKFSRLLDQFSSKAPSFRPEREVQELNQLLLEIGTGCDKASAMLGELN
jgi:hypothetical protein